MTTRLLLGGVGALALTGLVLGCGGAPPEARDETTPAMAETSPDGTTLPGAVNYSRVDATVACGGATSTEALHELRRRGFNAVINLRQPDEAGADVDAARRTAEEVGLRYVHIPMSGSNPQPETADAFLEAVQDPANSPVYIHCGSANRVGAMWLIKRVVVDGWEVERATEEAEQVGLKSPQLKQFALDYLATRRG